MKAHSAQSLCQIEIPLTAGNTVQQKDGWMYSWSRSGIEYGQKTPPLSVNKNSMHIWAVSAGPVMGFVPL